MHKSANIYFEFTAFRGPDGLVFHEIEASREMALGVMTVNNISYQSDSEAFDPYLPDHGNWTVLDGGFFLPEDFKPEHPTFRALLALGFQEETSLQAILAALASMMLSEAQALPPSSQP